MQTGSKKESDHSPRDTVARQQDFNCWLALYVFFIAIVEDAITHTVFNSIFGDKIRHVGSLQAKYKILLIWQAY